MRLAFSLAAIMLALPAAALAQARGCAIPAELPQPRVEGPSADQPRRLMATTGYTLALSWTPHYCHGKAETAGNAFQCGTPGRFGFSLHGLWPDGTGGRWPQYCRAARPLPVRVIRANLCATPSVQLLQHEWEKHGTCMAASPDAYFARATGLYHALRFPDMAALAADDTLTVGRFAAAFAARNRGWTADMVRVTTDRGGWLDELWLCLDTRFRPGRCVAGTGGAVRSAKLRIEPRG